MVQKEREEESKPVSAENKSALWSATGCMQQISKPYPKLGRRLFIWASSLATQLGKVGTSASLLRCLLDTMSS